MRVTPTPGAQVKSAQGGVALLEEQDGGHLANLPILLDQKPISLKRPSPVHRQKRRID